VDLGRSLDSEMDDNTLVNESDFRFSFLFLVNTWFGTSVGGVNGMAGFSGDRCQ